MWHGDDDTMQGFGCPGGCHGTNGPVYQWVQGVDGLGNPVGYWRPARAQAAGAPYTRNATPLLGDVARGDDGRTYRWVQGVDGLGSPFGFWKRVRGFVRRALPLARHFAPFVPGASAALTAATPFLRRVGVAGADGLGALYEAPDGSMYQVQGIDAGDDLEGLSAEEELNGFGAQDELDGFEADDELNGFAADDELNGPSADDELNGFGAEDALDGMDAGDDLDGIDADDELSGLADEELSGLADEELQGVGDDDATMNGYVRDAGMNGVEGFRPAGPRQTPMFSPPPNAPMWAPIW